MEQKTTSKDIDIKIGSEDMVFWRDVKEAREQDLKNTIEKVAYLEAIVEMCKKKYKDAEKTWQTETTKEE